MIKKRIKKEIVIIFFIICVIVVCNIKTINKKIVYTFGNSTNITLEAVSICMAYYKPLNDAFYIDVHFNNIISDKYVYGIKLNNHTFGNVGDNVKINAKLYELGNTFIVEYVDSEFINEDEYFVLKKTEQYNYLKEIKNFFSKKEDLFLH